MICSGCNGPEKLPGDVGNDALYGTTVVLTASHVEETRTSIIACTDCRSPKMCNVRSKLVLFAAMEVAIVEVSFGQ